MRKAPNKGMVLNRLLYIKIMLLPRFICLYTTLWKLQYIDSQVEVEEK